MFFVKNDNLVSQDSMDKIPQIENNNNDDNFRFSDFKWLRFRFKLV